MIPTITIVKRRLTFPKSPLISAIQTNINHNATLIKLKPNNRVKIFTQLYMYPKTYPYRQHKMIHYIDEKTKQNRKKSNIFVIAKSSKAAKSNT